MSLKNLQMWFQKIKLNAYRQLILDHLLGIDTAFMNHFISRNFAKSKDYTNAKEKISFLVLVQEIALDSLQSHFLSHVVSQKTLKAKLIDTQLR